MASSDQFGDSLSVIAAELHELGKRPVSVNTHAELLKLRDRLESILETFTLCPVCGGTFPPDSMAQLTLSSRSAVLCTTCAITALQHGRIDMRYESSSSPQEKSSGSDNGPKSRSRSTSVTTKKSVRVEPETPVDVPPPVEPEVDDDSENTDNPVDYETDDFSDGQETPPELPEHTPAISETTGASRIAPSSMPKVDIEQLKETPPARRKKRTAKGPSDDSVLKATVAEAARFTGLSTRYVRQIAKLIEEISPPMDVEKSTRYVRAELKNSRSRIPADAIEGVVAVLKEGVPSDNDADSTESEN